MSRRDRLLPVAVFLAGFVVMAWFYRGTVFGAGEDRGVPGNDSYYHVRMAEMLPRVGMIDEFPWLRFCFFTREGQSFVSHHVGFHALLSPFVHLARAVVGDELAGARWAMCFFFALNLLLFERILRALQVRWRLFWLLLFFLMPTQFFARHAFIRAIAPSLTFMLLICWTVLQSRPRLTALALFGYVHLYLGGVIYGPMLIVLYAVACVAAPREERALPLRLILWSLGGWLAGVLTYPYAGGMFEFLRLQVFGSGLTPDIEVGQEWMPYENLWWFANMAGPVLSTLTVAMLVRLRMGPRIAARDMYLLLTALAFLILNLKARRFVEYWPILALLSAASLSAPLTSRVAGWFDESFEPDGRTARRARGVSLALMSLGLVVVAAIGGRYQWRAIHEATKTKYDLPAIRGAMDYLKANSSPGDVVFTDDWDVFPVYFFFNQHNHYIVGLDPKFTQERRPDLWARYVRITRGQIPGDATYDEIGPEGKKEQRKIPVRLEDIREHFAARWVVADRDHLALADRLARAKEFAELVYPSADYDTARQAPYIIFRIRE